MTLAVFCFAVGDTVPLVGHRAQGLGKHGELVDLHGRFAFSCGECFAFDTNPIAHIEQLVSSPIGFADTFLVEVDLNTTFDITDGGENGFPHITDGEQAAGDGDWLFVCEVGLEFARGGGDIEFSAEWVDSEFTHFSELFASDGDKFCLCRLRIGLWGVWTGWLVAHEARRIWVAAVNSQQSMVIGS